MPDTYNIYCDESCHLENDHQKVMVLGAIWCPQNKAHEIATRLREIKAQHRMPEGYELKWSKVSGSKLSYYRAVVDYFFDDGDLHYRGLIVPNKDGLQHKAFGQDHDTWYFKMYFQLLTVLLSPDSKYRIYLDIKDTCSAAKVAKLHEVLCNKRYDFDRQIVERVQTVRSHEIEALQVCDLITGALSYLNRNLDGSAAKLTLIDRLRQRSGLQLTKNTLLAAKKVNLFRWEMNSMAQ